MTDSNASLPKPGEVIAGKYRVEQVLGAGGMGVVVAARHVALRQAVAVKFLLPQAMKLQGASERFLREAQAAVAITSEHVARVLDVGTLESGALFMVMEHLNGTDLAKLLKQRGALSIEDAVGFVLQAGEAIAEAHALGIVHRDLKPSNIFLTRRAEGSALVKVLDFGLSKMASSTGNGDHSLTATDVVAGSPDYMSPEQVRSLKNVDGRTDIWALGVVLYELLTTRRPFHGPTPAAICASVAADRPLPVRSLRADVSEALDAAILRCLEKDPNARPQNMGDLARSLAPFAPAESKASVERIVRLSPGGAASAASWGDGGEAVTLPIGARAASAATPGNMTLRVSNAPPQALAASAPSFAVPASTGARESVAERPGAPAATLSDVGATQPSGPAGGWGQTRPPSRRTSTLAIAGAALAAIVAVGVVGWQVFLGSNGGTASAPGSGVSAAESPSESTSTGVSVNPGGVILGSPSATSTSSSPALTTASATPTSPDTPASSSHVAAPAATSSSSASSSSAPVSTSSSTPKAAPSSTAKKGSPSKPPAPPTGTSILDKPL